MNRVTKAAGFFAGYFRSMPLVYRLAETAYPLFFAAYWLCRLASPVYRPSDLSITAGMVWLSVAFCYWCIVPASWPYLHPRHKGVSAPKYALYFCAALLGIYWLGADFEASVYGR